MFTKISKALLFFSFVLFIVTSAAGQAKAATPFLEYELDTQFEQGSNASGNPIATFDNDNSSGNGGTGGDSTNAVLLTMDISNFTSSTEGILGWYFNFTGTIDGINPLTLTHISGAQASTTQTGNECCIANGDGNFDFVFNFPDQYGLGKDEGGVLTSVYEISYTSAITFSNFNDVSSSGGGQGTYGSAAQVNDIGGNDQGSGWRGDTAGVIVPEPISSTLFIIGGATLGGFRILRRKRK